MHQFAGETAWSVLDRVYRQNDRRTLAEYARPTPGVAREFWPQDLHDWKAGDAYGWGATTANLLLRHLMGIQESAETSTWSLDLVPAIPRPLQIVGRTYGVRHSLYRGRTFDLSYEWSTDGLAAVLSLPESVRCRIFRQGKRTPVYRSKRAARTHRFLLENGALHRLTLLAA
jgi:hypothetical protein